MKNNFLHLIQSPLLWIDIFSLNVLALLYCYLFENDNWIYQNNYLQFLMIINISWLVITCTSKLYHRKNCTSDKSILKPAIRNCFYWLLCVIFLTFFVQYYALSHMYTAMALGSFSILLVITRIVYFDRRSFFETHEFSKRQVLIIGFNEQAKKIANYFETKDINTNIVGFC